MLNLYIFVVSTLRVGLKFRQKSEGLSYKNTENRYHPGVQYAWRTYAVCPTKISTEVIALLPDHGYQGGYYHCLGKPQSLYYLWLSECVLLISCIICRISNYSLRFVYFICFVDF